MGITIPQCLSDHTGSSTTPARRKEHIPLTGTANNAKTLAVASPELVKQWHPTKNGSLTPQIVKNGSHDKAWWVCEKGHEWQASINNRTHKGRKTKRGCPYCSGKILTKERTLSAVCPELVKQWHPTKNNLTPDQVAVMSGKKAWWRCPKNHVWYAQIASRSKGSGCPYCSGRVAWSKNCLKYLFPKMASQWHPHKNGDQTPLNTMSTSRISVWWKCWRGHEWKTQVCERTKHDRDCPYCDRKLPSEEYCLGRLFPKIAKRWHTTKNKGMTPWEVFPKSSKHFWWQCEQKRNHSWKMSVQDKVKGGQCPHCRTEAKIKKAEDTKLDLSDTELYIQTLNSVFEHITERKIMAHDPETMIQVMISPKLAHAIAQHLKNVNSTSLAGELQKQFTNVINSLTTIGQLGHLPQLWKMPFVDMKTAIVVLLKEIELNKAVNRAPQNELAKELVNVAKELLKQILKIEDTEYNEFLEYIAPGFVMETKCGVNPLQGSTAFMAHKSKKRG